MITTVANLKTSGRFANSVYCGRPRGMVPPQELKPGTNGSWGNPYILHSEDERAAVLEHHANYWDLRTTYDAEFRQAAIRDLPGHVLTCFCHPLGCHCDHVATWCNSGCPYMSAEQIKRFTDMPAMLITGSRDMNARMARLAASLVRRLYHMDWRVIVGDAEGVDAVVLDTCLSQGVHAECYGAYGRMRRKSRTGDNYPTSPTYPARDLVMAHRATACIGIWNGESSGTKLTFEAAKELDKPMTYWNEAQGEWVGDQDILKQVKEPVQV